MHHMYGTLVLQEWNFVVHCKKKNIGRDREATQSLFNITSSGYKEALMKPYLVLHPMFVVVVLSESANAELCARVIFSDRSV